MGKRLKDVKKTDSHVLLIVKIQTGMEISKWTQTTSPGENERLE